MPGDDKELENLNAEDFAEISSLAEFVDIEDLESLEGIEEFLDFDDLDGADTDAPAKELDAEEPKKRAVPELFDETPQKGQSDEDMPISEMFDGAQEDFSGEIPMPDESEQMSEEEIPATEEALVLENALEEALTGNTLEEEIPMPDMFDESPKEEIPEEESGEVPIPDALEEALTGDTPEEEIPMPDALEEALTGDTPEEEIPMPDMFDETPKEEISEEELGEIPIPDESEEMLLPDDMAEEEIPIPDVDMDTDMDIDLDMDMDTDMDIDLDMDMDFDMDTDLDMDMDLDMDIDLDMDMAEEDIDISIPDVDVTEEEIPIPEADIMETEPEEVALSLEEEDDEILQDEEIPMPDLSQEPEQFDDSDMLADMDVQEGDLEMANEETSPDMLSGENDAMETEGMTADSNEDGADDLDMMLDGLLGDLDMKGDDDLSDDDMLSSLADSVEEIDDESDELLDVAIPESAEEQKSEEKQPGLMKRLFGNVVTDEIAEEERKAMEEEEAKAAEKAELDEQKKAEKEEAKAAAAAEKEAKKAAKKEEKAAKKAEKEARKAEKKAQREEEEAAELEITGKLNKVGVAIIAVLTVLFLATEIIGTNIHGYNSTKKQAKEYFEMGKYSQAYEEVMGTDIRTKDPETYDKIRTVMQVQRSIDSYNNYNEMNFYPDALNALIRGIQRYDSNIERARELEVVTQMDGCKAEIVSLLQSEFGVSETEARSILALEKPQYTERVVSIALAKNS